MERQFTMEALNQREIRQSINNDIFSNRFVIYTLIVIFFMVLLMNFLTPESSGDDYNYKFSYAYELGEKRVDSLTDVVISQYHHYFLKNGRSLVHIVVQMFTGIWGKSTFNIANALMMTLFIFLLAKLSRNVSPLNLFFFGAIVLLFFPTFQDSFLWMSGSVNYLWIFVGLTIFFIYLPKLLTIPFRKYHVLLIIPGVILGWSHEGIAIALSLGLSIYFLSYGRRGFKSAAFPLFIGIILGTIVCILSPAHIKRGQLEQFDDFQNFKHRIRIGLNIIVKMRLFFILCLSILFKFILSKDKKDFFISLYKSNVIFIWAILISLGIIFMSGVKTIRTGSGLEYFSLIFLISVFKNSKISHLKILKTITIVLGSLLYIIILPYSIKNYTEYKNILNNIKNNNLESYWVIYDDKIIPDYLHAYIVPPFSTKSINHNHDVPSRLSVLYGYEKLSFLPKNIYEDIIEEKTSDGVNTNTEYSLCFKRVDEDSIYKQPYYVFFNGQYDRKIESDYYEILNIKGKYWIFSPKMFFEYWALTDFIFEDETH